MASLPALAGGPISRPPCAVTKANTGSDSVHGASDTLTNTIG